MVTLHQITAGLFQKRFIALGFNAFCHNLQAQIVSHVDGRANDHLIGRCCLDIRDEGFVDFQYRGIQILKIGQ